MYSHTSRFLTLAAALPLAAIAATAQHTGTTAQPTGTYTFQHENVLGTSLQITVRTRTPADAQHVEAAILATFDRDQQILSTWRPDSEASRWAATRFEAVPVSPELLTVLAAFDSWRDRTHGALDPSIEAATRLWQTATTQGRTPTAHEIATTVEAIQQPHWSLDRTHGTATRLTDVPLAFATFTKSYITARAADAALQAGATGVMLNVGGDVVVRGDLVQLVAIADPLASTENDAPLGHLAVHDAALATSGSYRRGFQLAANTRFSHLIDPRTAQPTAQVLSSTVLAKDAVTAGALATAFSILPVEESRKLAATLPGVQYLLIFPGGEQVRSEGWPQSTVRPVAFHPPAPAAAGLWNPAFELNLELNLPRIQDARYRRPYVAVWVEDADHFPVRTLALWTQNPRWLNELKQWYRDDQIRHLAEGTDISRTISSATRPPGKYNLKWDGKDNEGNLVKAGKYTVSVEVSREHGGYDIERHELTVDGTPQQASLAPTKELGAVTLDYRRR